MRSSCPPTAAQRAWFNQLVSIGCIATGARQVHIHHLEGRCFKHRKTLVGNWWTIPVAIELHDVHSNSPLNVTHNKHAFHAEYGSPDVLLMKARKLVLRRNPDAVVIPEHILELAHDYYEPKEITDWHAELGITKTQEKAA